MERRNPDGTATIVETPYQPTGARATSRDGAARILLADRRRVPAGDEVEIPVYLFYPRGTANLSFDLQYDPAVVQPVDKPERGALIRGSQRFRSNNVSRGLIKIAFAETQALGRSGIVAFARFKAIGSPGQRSAIRLTVTQLNDPENRPLSMDVYDGEVEIIRAGAGLPGDNDNSGRLTVWNAQSALDMDVKLIPENLRLDMDRDGRVTSADARIIFQRIEIGATDWRSNR